MYGLRHGPSNPHQSKAKSHYHVARVVLLRTDAGFEYMHDVTAGAPLFVNDDHFGKCG